MAITGDYQSATGGKDFDVLGIDIEVLPNDRLRFWMVNDRPPVDESGNLMDATKVGANSTIESFELSRGSSNLEYVKTVLSDSV